MGTNDRDPIDPESGDPIAARLARLRERRVDTSRLARRVEAVVGPADSPAGILARIGTWRLAATIIVVSSLAGAVLWWGSRPVLASPADLARIHSENSMSAPGAIKVTSVAEARQVVGVQWSQCPHLPSVRVGSLVSCHVQRLNGKRMCCLALQLDGQVVSLAVARARDIREGSGTPIIRSGKQFFAQSFETTNMVTFDRAGTWACVMGSLPTDRLIEIATTLTFGEIDEHVSR